MAAHADLEPPKGLEFELGLGLGSGWSRPTCKVEIDHTRPAQSFLPTSPAHNQNRTIEVRLIFSEALSSLTMVREPYTPPKT